MDPVRLHRSSVNHQCSFCGAVNPDVLRRCSLCKSVYYCDRECQKADYKAGHRQECIDCVQPPFTTAFLTTPIDGVPYAPVLAHRALDGVGCWFSVTEREKLDTTLQRLETPFPKRGPKACAKREARVARDTETAEKHLADVDCLFTMQFLVQNRRKDGKPVLLLGAQTRLMSDTDRHAVTEMMRGHLAVDPIHTCSLDGHLPALIPVTTDPFERRPRLHLSNFDGTKLSTRPAESPAGILDVTRGIVVLHPGQYAIYEAQFRVGDGGFIFEDEIALRHLAIAFIPVVSPWNVGSDATAYDRSISNCFNRAAPQTPIGIPCIFKEEAVTDYYDNEYSTRAKPYSAHPELRSMVRGMNTPENAAWAEGVLREIGVIS